MTIPFEFDGLTISQIIAIVMLVFGMVLMAVFQGMKPDKLSAGSPK